MWMMFHPHNVSCKGGRTLLFICEDPDFCFLTVTFSVGGLDLFVRDRKKSVSVLTVFLLCVFDVGVGDGFFVWTVSMMSAVFVVKETLTKL